MGDIEEKEENEEYGDDGQEKANVIFAKVVANPPRNRMLEVTNLPLDKLRPLTWMKTFNVEAVLLFDDIYTAQLKYTNVFKRNRDDALAYGREYIVGLIKEAQGGKLPVENNTGKKGKKVKKVLTAEQFILNCERELKRIDALKSLAIPDIKWVTEWETLKPSLILLSDEWIHTYCQARRSLNGEFMRHAVVLTQDQIAANQDVTKENLPDMPQ